MNINRIAYTTTALGLAFIAALPGVASANPAGGSVAAGTATITNSPLNTDINQSTNKAVINWSSFNIAPNETTSFHQPGASSVTLNRIGDANPSSILGTLNANGQVMLINPNGMMFGNNSHVNVGGLVATTADIDNTDFMNGNYTFGTTGNKNASITNNGHINVDDGGYAALVAPTVNNNGTIAADMGKVALGGADSFVLDLTGDNLINFAVPTVSGQRGNAATVNNNGSVIADQGKVLMTADSARNAVNSAVNNSGLVQARRVYRHNGVVSLVADNINAGGTIDVQGNHGSHGGTVNLTANKNLSFSGDIKANSNSHGEDGGTVNLTGKTVALGGTINTADDGGWRGNTNITAGDTMNIGSNEAYTIDSAMEHSGNVNVAANKTINVNSDIDTSSQHGDGTLKFKDGDSNGALTANLNAKIDLGNHQRLRGEATKVNVASTGDIQNGVDVASTDGAQVNVAVGTYDGDVDVNKKNIDLRGANWNVAEGANPGTPGAASKVNGTVTVTADNDSVRGFTIDPANGVVVNNADNATIANNVIQGSGGNSTAGVKLSNADNATVKSNTVSGFGTDVQATNSDDATIQGNSLGSKNGIALNSSDDAVIKGNTLAYSGPSTSGDTGISLNNHSDSANVANNTVTDYNTGVNVANSDDANIHGNTVADSKTGVKASNDDGLKVQNNVLVGRGSTTANSVGIDVSNDDGATLNGNTIVNYETGAKVANSDDVNFKNNVATGVKTGLSANHADRIAATGNTLVGANPAQGDGMLVRNSNNVNTKLSHNTVTNFLNPRRLINTTE